MNENIFLCKKNTFLYVEGDEDTERIFIIQKGQLQLTYSNHRMNDISKIVGPGDIVGFTSALSNRPRTENVFALEDTSVIVLSKNNFMEKLLKNTDMAFRIINYFAKQLREYNDLITWQNKVENQNTTPQNLLQNAVFYYKLGHLESAYYIFSKLLTLYPNHPAASEASPMFEKIKQLGQPFTLSPQFQGIYRIYADKQMIFCEDEPGDELFIIRKGRVKIVRQSRTSEMILNVLKEGDIFGELAIVSQKPRNATAISIGTTTVLPINQASLTKLIQRSPMILKRIFIAISNRVWFTHTRLDTVTYNNSITKMYLFLKNKLIEENVSLQNTDPYTFSFGIDELEHMVDSSGRDNDAETEILGDPNLSFHPGHIMVKNPKLLAAKAHYYMTKDSMYGQQADEPRDKNQATTLNLNALMSPPVGSWYDPQQAVDNDAVGSGNLFSGSFDAEPVLPLLQELDEFNDFNEED